MTALQLRTVLQTLLLGVAGLAGCAQVVVVPPPTPTPLFHDEWFEPVAAVPTSQDLFRMSPEACLKHCAVLSAPRPGDPEPRMIHAYWGRAVVESWLGPWWRRRLAHVFSFPDVSD